MTLHLFSRRSHSIGKSYPEPIGKDDLQSILGMNRASLHDAVLYSGPLVREILDLAPLVGDRKYLTVDIKVHDLRRGEAPQKPGWHTDGAPRMSSTLRVSYDEGYPSYVTQEDTALMPHRYHLFVTGTAALTRFLDRPVNLSVPDVLTPTVSNDLTRQVQQLKQAGEVNTVEAPSQTWVTFDWWTLHTARQAAHDERRLLIRVCESDYIAPFTDLRTALRPQSHVFAPLEFGL